MSEIISGLTRLVGVMGWPVSHSRSPLMHNAAFAALGLDWSYVPLPVRPEHIGDAVRGLAALGFAGANVTVPHKQAVMPLLDELTPAASAIGAVNTIVVRPDGSLLGDNTDGMGFLADLRAHGVAARRCLVIGSGGAARAVAYALAAEGLAVAVAARSVDKAAALCGEIRSAIGKPASADAGGAFGDTAFASSNANLSVHQLPDDLPLLARDADLIVNATSLGLHQDDGLPWDEAVPFHRGQVVYDLIYNRPTPLLALARSQGAAAIDGLGMLVYQGARAFELWTGHAAPVEVMQQVLAASPVGG